MKSVQAKARTAIYALYAFAACAALGVLSQSMLAVFLHGVQNGSQTDSSLGVAADSLGALSGLAYVVAFLVFGVAFLSWFFTAHKNLHGAGLDPRYGSGWAIGGFFVPFLNLVRPYQVMKELWQGSEYLSDNSEQVPWRERKAGSLVGQWWTLVILSGVAARVFMRTVPDEDTVAALLEGAYKGLLSDSVDVGAAIVTIMLVRRITRFQDFAESSQEAEPAGLEAATDPV